MKITRNNDGNVTIKVLAGMIRNSSVLGRISSRWEGKGLFPSEAANVIGTLAVEFHRKHGKSPKSGMVALVESWAEGRKDDELSDLVGRLLSQVQQEDAKLAAEHYLDMAGKLFDKTVLESVGNRMLQMAEAGQTEKAFALLAEKGRKVELGSGAGVDVLGDDDAVRGWFNQERRTPLVRYPGDAGKFFRDSFARGAFVAFLAREKGTKSTWLLDVAYRAIRQRWNVAYFDVGDNPEEEVGVRIEERICRWPSYSSNDDETWPCKIRIPKVIEYKDGYDIARVTEWKDKEFAGPLTGEMAVVGNQRLKKYLHSSREFLKLSCHATLTMGVAGIKSILQSRALDGWVADVCVIDYADNLAPPPGRLETRDAINRNWQLMRSLSQEMHCLVVTATQAKASAHEARSLGMKHFSDDKRKLAHCTAKYGINRTLEEEEAEVGRLTQVVVRKGKLRSKRQLHYASCLAIASPCECSTFGEDPKKKETTNED